jgi:hypothetical protein
MKRQRQDVDPKISKVVRDKLLIEANAVVWKTKQTTLTGQGPYFSHANYPLIICKLGQNFNW